MPDFRDTPLDGALALSEDDVPDRLADPLAGTPVWQIAADAFLLSLPMGLVFHYRRGAGTTFRRWPGVSDEEVALFFGGTVLGAIAWLNGLIPLQASAVVHEGRVHAFAAPTGEGKSTLAAALARRGMAVFADEVLVVDPRDPARIVALPGAARLALWGDALALAGCDAGPAVRTGIDKFYVPGLAAAPRAPLPVARLCFLDGETGAAPGITGIAPDETFGRLVSAWYRPHFAHALIAPDALVEGAMRLAGAIPMGRLHRARAVEAFDAAVDRIAADIREHG